MCFQGVFNGFGLCLLDFEGGEVSLEADGTSLLTPTATKEVNGNASVLWRKR